MRPTRFFTVVASGMALLAQGCSEPSGPPSSGTAVSSIEIAVRTDTLVAGDTATVRAVPRNPHGEEVTGVTVTLTSSDTSVVRFESGSIARGRRAGASVIQASVGTVAASATLTVVPGAAVSLDIEADTLRFVALQQKLDVVLEGEDAYGNALSASSVQLMSRDTTVAKPLGTTAVESRGAGATWVVAESGGVADSAAVVVEQVVARIEVTPAEDTLNAIGDTLPLTGTAYDAEDQTIPDAVPEWTSLDPATATVDDEGRVVSVTTGVGRVEFRIGTFADTARVLSRQVPASLAIGPDTVALGRGDVLRLLRAVQDSNAVSIPDSALVWSSSPPGTIDVSEDGEVTPGGGPVGVVWAETGGLTDSVVGIVDDDGVLRTWRGGHPGSETTFLSPYNWWYGGEPGVQDTIRISGGVTDWPILEADAQAARIEVLTGAQLDLADFDLAVTHSVHSEGSFSGDAGSLLVRGAAVALTGSTPRLLVTGTGVVDAGTLRVQRRIRVDGGTLRSDGQHIEVENP